MTGAPWITFLGAAGTVTGSKYLVEADSVRVLVDCGLFQGIKGQRQRNWQALSFDAASIDAVILTHAHLDHSGYLPVLIKRGFKGPVYCTSGTKALCEILLLDAGHLQEEEARHANKHGYSKHRPALPLYTREDAEDSLSSLTPVEFEQPVRLGSSISAQFTGAGHILGAASVHLDIDGTRVVFSGDVGRPHDPVMRAPEPIRRADYLVVESTYGNRRHAGTDPALELAAVITRTARRGGVVLIPSFAVGRAQTLLHLLVELRARNEIPAMPVYLNSPMAIDATEIFCAHPTEHRLMPAECQAMCAGATYVNSVEKSKWLNERRGPMIIVSASGMATGGRILHHLKAFAHDHRNTVLFTGYQAAGTRGEAMLTGARHLKIHGQEVPVRAEIAQISGLSAHADYVELTDWLRGLERPPVRTFVTHGEARAAGAFSRHLGEVLGWTAETAVDGARHVLGT